MVPLSPARKRLALLAALVAGSLTVQSLPAGAQAPTPRADRPVAITAPPGAPPVSRPLPPDAAVDRALPGAPRPPAVPPGVAAAGAPHRLSAAERAAAPKPAAPKSASSKPVGPKSAGPAKGPADGGGGGDPATGAQNVTLRPGFALGDTSVVVYFDATDPGVSAWSSWQATVYDAATSTAQVSVTLPPSEATPCAALRQFCRTFGAADGWALVPDQQYFATITVTLADGTQVTSAPSDTAKARGTIVPPAIPDQQAAGCACGDVLYPATPGQAVRGSGVNTGTGSFIWSDSDLQLASFGEPFIAARTYSSATTSAGSLGIGWTWSLDIRVIPPAGDATAVTVRAEDGAQAVFTRNADGSFARPPNVRANLSAVTSGGWQLVTPDQRTFAFGADGRLTSVKNSRGLGLTIVYTATKWTVTDAAGHKVTIDVGTDGLITKITLPDGRSVKYRYTDSQLTGVTDVMGNTWKYTYTNRLLVKIVDPRGYTAVTNTYGTTGRVTAQADALGAVTTFAWDGGRHEATTIDPDGVSYFDGYRDNVLLYSQNGAGDTINRRYDAALDPSLLVDAKGNQSESGFDAAGNATSTLAPQPFLFSELTSFDGHNNPTSATDGLGNTTTYAYTSFDEMESLTDPLGNQEVTRRDDRGLVTATVDPRGKTTTMTYDASGNLIAQITPLGEKTTFGYDKAGRLTSTTDPRGSLPGANPADFTTRFEYDDADRLVKTWAPGKKKPSETVYDEVGQTVKTIDPLGRTTTYCYDKVINRLLSTTDANDGTTADTYSRAGRQLSVVDAEGNKTTNTYDSRGNLATVVSPKGNVPGANAADYTTTYVYDRNGNLIQTRHPYPGGGTVDSDTGYDELDRPTTSVDPFGKVTGTGYNNLGDVTSVVDPLGHTFGLQYDKNGRPTVATQPEGGNSVGEYDGAGNLIKLTNPVGGVAAWTYDDDGRVATAVDPRGNVPGANPADFTTRYTYDAAGNVIAATDPLGHTTRFSYDTDSRVVTVTDANNHATRYDYDDGDQLSAAYGPDAGSPKKGTAYTYDGVGNITGSTDPNGHATTYRYDKLSRTRSTVDPLKRETKYRYDAQSNLTDIVMPGSDPAAKRTITSGFDILDRLTTRQLGSGGPAFGYGYDAKDRLTSLVDPTGTRTQAYDDVDQLTSVTRGPGQTFGYTYDRDGNVKTRTFPDGTTAESVFSAFDQLTSLTVTGGAAGPTPATYGFTYDPAGRPLRTTYPGSAGLVTDRGYDNAGALVDLASRAGTADVARFQIARDPVGNPAQVTTTRDARTQSVAYRYDVADRLTAACYGVPACDSKTANNKPADAVTYAYDRVGNRTSQTLSGSAGNSTTTYTYDAADQLTKLKVKAGSKETRQSLSYDPQGNLTTSGSTTFTYNLDRTKASAAVGGSTTRYGYDAAGLRISATTGTTARTWSWDVNADTPRLALESATAAGAPPTTRGFLTGPRQTSLGLLSGGAATLLPDAQDGVAAMAGPDGVTQAEYDYDPYGNPRTNGTAGQPSSVDNPIQFGGAYRDPTLGNEYFFPARDYDPTTGRFDGLDPIQPSQRTPAVSPYTYVGDRPTVLRDPTGASSNPLHDAAEATALPQLYARYGARNVYAGDVAPVLRGVPGQICVPTVRPRPREPLTSCPDIIVRAGSRTFVYEVKPASRYGRSLGTSRQVGRYTRSLLPPRFPNAGPGPNIVPAVGPAPGGGLVIIFSVADWSTFAPPKLRQAVNGSGVIYYTKAQGPQQRPATRPAPAPKRAPAKATNPSVVPAMPSGPDVGLIPDLGDQLPDEGLIPNLGDFLHPAPDPAPAQPNAPVGCGAPAAALTAVCPPGQVPGGGYVPFPPGIWDPIPVPGLPVEPFPIPAIP